MFRLTESLSFSRQTVFHMTKKMLMKNADLATSTTAKRENTGLTRNHYKQRIEALQYRQDEDYSVVAQPSSEQRRPN